MSADYNNEEANEFFFQDKDEEVCIGIIPASEVIYFPRVGEIVSLPKHEGSEGGYYVITHIVHSFIADLLTMTLSFALAVFMCERRLAMTCLVAIDNYR